MLPSSHTSQNRRMRALLSSADIGSLLSSFLTHLLSKGSCCRSLDEQVREKSLELQRRRTLGPPEQPQRTARAPS
jgi:hypothetical protein